MKDSIKIKGELYDYSPSHKNHVEKRVKIKRAIAGIIIAMILLYFA